MSNPSFSNIDLWLFELAEGNLTPAQIEQLELFLLQHPELDVDRDVWEMATVSPSVAEYPDQNSLRKKRPVAWYAFGSVAAVCLFMTGWYMLSGIGGNGTQQLAGRHFDISVLKSFNENHSRTSASARTVSTQKANEGTGDNVQLAEAVSGSNSSNQVGGGSVEPISAQPQIAAVANNPNPGSVTHQGTRVQIQSGTLTPTVASSLYGSSSMSMVVSIADKMDRLSAGVLSITGVEEQDIELRQVQQFEVLDDNDFALAEGPKPRTVNSYGMSSGEYKQTLKSRLSTMSRKLQRMMNNPVALKNYRDPYYHVPGMLPNDLSFSSTGTMLSTRVQTLSRLQWYGKKNEQLQNQLAIDGYAYGMRGGLGLQVNHTMYNDGGMNIASAALTYSPKLSISRTISVEPSLRFKMGNKSLTKSKMENISQVELERGNAHEFYPEGGVIGQQLWYKDLGAGLMVNTEWFFAGVQMDNLFRHKDNIYSQDFEEPRRADYHFVGTFGTDWVSKRENLSLSPYFVYQKSENLSEAWLGANFRWNWFTVGGAISSNMEPVGSIGLKFDHFALSYNADYVVSAMTGQRALSHQLTLRFVSKPSRFGKRLLNL